MACASGLVMSRVQLFLLLLMTANQASRKENSGRVVDSILMISAPIAPSILVAMGPAMTQLKSTTRTPVKGSVAVEWLSVRSARVGGVADTLCTGTAAGG